jgi:hypothetical protein
MQSRRKAWIVILAVFLALLLAGAATLVVRGFLQLQEVDRKLQGASETLTSLFAQNPFPSSGNLRVERENIGIISRELMKLQQAMAAGQIEPAAQSPAKCITQFWETRNAQLARAGNTTRVDKGFDFGFGRHMKGDLPSIQDVPRITQQLKIVEALCDILFAAKISALTGFSREEFESEVASATAPGKPGAAPLKAGNEVVVKNTVNAMAGLVPPGQLYGSWHFALQFTARESALVKVLNGLSRSPVFAVVTRMEVKGDEKVFDRKEAEAIAARSAENPEGGNAREASKSRDARVVCGRDALLNVRLELDVYQFAKPQESEMARKREGEK